jgi:hypothetical protein
MEEESVVATKRKEEESAVATKRKDEDGRRSFPRREVGTGDGGGR